MRARDRWAAAVLATVASLAGTRLFPVAAATAASVGGFRVDQVTTVAPGVEYRRLVRSDGPVVAHVVSIRPTVGSQVEAVLSNDRVGGPEPIAETTSSMCARLHCLVAVNGDFASPATGQPIGGVVQGGRLVRSPILTQPQLSVGAFGATTAGTAAWAGQVVTSDLAATPLDALNRERAPDQVVLYTPAFGPTTGTDPSGTELVVRAADVQLPLGLGQASVIELVTLVDGGSTAIPSDGAVLSGQGAGAAALRALWARANASALGGRAAVTVQLEPPALESIGGGPVLVHDRRSVLVDDGSDFVDGRHPRTLVGWSGSETFLVAVDGRQPGYSVGMTLPEAAALLSALGAQDGINLDGGGSTTLVVNGTVVNRPSDRLVHDATGDHVVALPGPGQTVLGPVERPVADAFALVPSSPLQGVAHLVGPVLRVPGPSVARVKPAADPASSRPGV
jgi:hypothetical protein